MNESIGWLGAVLFATCAFPQALQCVRDGHAKGLNWFFLIAWLLGEILTIIYVFPKKDIILLSNYFINLLFVCIIIRYKLFEKIKQ